MNITDKQLLDALNAWDRTLDPSIEPAPALTDEDGDIFSTESQEAMRAALEAALIEDDTEEGEEWIQYGHLIPGLPAVIEPRGRYYAMYQRTVKAGPWEPVGAAS